MGDATGANTADASSAKGASSGLAIEVRELKVVRSGRPVLHDVTLSVGAGEIYALLGGNGAGKSTTLLTLLGFLAPASGLARVQGWDVVSQRTAVRKAVAYLPEAAALYPHLSARDNLAYFLGLAKQRLERARLEQALDRVGLPNRARGERLSTHSKGMRQKVAIALAVLREAPVLLLDEPTSGLDPEAIEELNKLLRGLADEGRSVLMVTHDVFGACRIADRIGFLRGGALVSTLVAPAGGRIQPEAVRSTLTEKPALGANSQRASAEPPAP